jgi:hypothetical protein
MYFGQMYYVLLGLGVVAVAFALASKSVTSWRLRQFFFYSAAGLIALALAAAWFAR